MGEMTDIAKEIEKLADKYRNQKRDDIQIQEEANDNEKKFTIDDFLTDNDSDDFDENFLKDLADESDEIIEEEGEEIGISDFVKPQESKKNIEGAAKDLLEKNNQKPKNKALSLIKNISKDLRDLKALIRS